MSRPSRRPSTALLRFMYLDLGWTRSDMAWLRDCEPTTVRYWLRSAGISAMRRPTRRHAPDPLGGAFFIELAQQTEMGWTPQQARAAITAAVRRASLTEQRV
jgi:hypothetical protein